MKIALIGPVGSGKTTISNALVSLLGGQRIAFADNLRGELAGAIAHVDANRLIPWGVGDERDLKASLVVDMEKPELKPKYRSLLQAWGEYRREEDVDYWVNQMNLRLESIIRFVQPNVLCVDDCRYPNEFELLTKKGFTFVRLEPNPAAKILTIEQHGHSSEAYWPSFPTSFVLPYQLGPIAQAHNILVALGVEKETI